MKSKLFFSMLLTALVACVAIALITYWTFVVEVSAVAKAEEAAREVDLSHPEQFTKDIAEKFIGYVVQLEKELAEFDKLMKISLWVIVLLCVVAVWKVLLVYRRINSDAKRK